MDAYSRLPGQFQVQHEGLVIVVELMIASRKQVPQQNYETNYQVFAGIGLDEIEPAQQYQFVRYIENGAYRGFVGYGGSNSDNRQSSSYGSPYRVGGSYDR